MDHRIIIEIIVFGACCIAAVTYSFVTIGKKKEKMSKKDKQFKSILDGEMPLPEKKQQRLKYLYWLQDLGYHAEAAELAYTWNLMDAKTKASYESHLKVKEAEKIIADAKKQ